MQDFKNGIKSVGKTALSMATNVGIDLLIGGAINLGAWGIDKIVNAQSDAIERGNKALEDYNNLNQKLSTSTAWVNTNSERYAELAKGVSYLGENIKLTSADYEEYQQLSQQIAQQFPELITGYNSMGQPIIGTAKSVEDLNQALKDQKYTEYSKSLKQAGDVADKFYEEIFRDKNWAWQEAGAQKQLDALNDFRESYNDAIATTGKDKYAKLFSLSNFQMDNNFIDALDTAGVSLGDFLDLTNELLRSEGNLETDSPALKTLNSIMASSVDLQSQIDQSTDTMRNYLPAFIKANKQYQDLAFENPELETQITALTRGFSLEDMVSRNFFDKDNGIQNIKKWANDAVSELSNSEMQQALTDVFTINDDASQKSFGQWRREADDALDKAATKSESLTGAWGREQMRQASGIADKYERLSKIQDDISARWEDESFGWDARNNLSMEDFETLGSIAIDDSFTGSYKEAVSQIATLQREARLSVSGIQKHVTDTQATLAAASSAVTESMSNTGLTSDSIKLIKEQVSSITEEFDELSNYDLNSLFTNSAKGVKLNNDRFEDLLQLQHQLKVADFAEQIGKQSDAVKTLTDDLSGLTEGTDEYNQKNTELINAQNQLSEMEQARSQYHAIYQQQQALFSEYAEWQRAQQTENAGDPYLNLLSGLEQAKEAYDQGLVGTDDFKTFAKIISPSGATDPINFAENYGTAAKYLTKDSSGITTFLQDLSTKTDAAGNAMASFNEQTGEWKMNIHSLGEVASALGTGETVVEAVLGRAEDYGETSYVISDMEDGILKTSEAIQKKAEAEVRLRQMQEANEKNPGTYNETAMQGAADEVEKYTQQINGLTESMQYMQEHPTENIVSNTAKQEIDELNKQRQQLLEEANGDTSSAAYKTAEELKNAIQSKADSANLELDAELNVTGVKQSAQEALKELQGQEGSVISPEIDFNYDKSTMSLNQLDSKIQELNAEKVRIQAEADTPEAQAALEQLDAETQALQSQKIQVKIQTAIEEGNSIDELLAMSDADIITTVGCDASEVDAVRQKLLEMQGESITASVKIDQAQFTSLINAITGQPVEVPVEADTSNVASQVEQSTSGTSVKVDVEPKPIDPNAVASLQSSQTVNVTGNVTTLTAGVGLTPVAVTGNVVQLTGTPSTPIDVVGNITEVTGGEGKTIEVIGHIATVTGGNGKMINVIGNITSVTGGDSTSGTINYEKGDVEKADGTVSTGIINYKKGDVEKADGTVSTGTINYDLGTVADAGSPVATGTINYKLGSVAKPGGATVTGTMASGTMLSSAQANGTAYNVLNMHPLTSANALGNVTVPRDQVSLTNEVGMNMPLYLLI